MNPFTLKNTLSRFRLHWADAPDARKPNNNTKYQVADAILAGFSVFFMQSSSFLAHQRFIQQKQGRNNATSLFEIERIPSDPQIRNLLDTLDVKHFHANFWDLYENFKMQGHLESFRSKLGTFLLAVDGLTYFSSENISCPECLKRQDRNGVEHFYHSAITPVIVKPGQEQVLPLPPEFIVPQDGNEKQDCERVAVKRWLSQHQYHFEPQMITYLGDDLYANQPLCQLIDQTYKQHFIFTCKPDSHPYLYETVAVLEKNGVVEKLSQRRWSGKHGEIWNYRWVNEVPLRAGDDAMNVNWCELVITHETSGAILYQNAFVTNHTLTDHSIAIVVEAGRSRWKIENENNNVLKTKGYHLEHNFGHGHKHLSNVLATLNLLAFLTHTIQEITNGAYQVLRKKLGARKTFFQDLRALTRYLIFDSWDALFQFMADGLEISLPSP